MKNIILIFTLFALAINFSTAQTKPTVKAKKTVKLNKVNPNNQVIKVEGAGMQFENIELDYGTVKHNGNGERQFVFVNNGTLPLVITNAVGSCGCTVPTFPKEPIAPGEKGVLKVNYDTKRTGPFSKTITVTSNAVQGNTKLLTIKGLVLESETKVAVPTKS